MANKDNNMTFVRCPSCNSLVPALSTRCRMCGANIEANDNQEKEEPKVESRIRQKTMTISESMKESIMEEFGVGKKQEESNVNPFSDNEATQEEVNEQVEPVNNDDPLSSFMEVADNDDIFESYNDGSEDNTLNANQADANLDNEENANDFHFGNNIEENIENEFKNNSEYQEQSDSFDALDNNNSGEEEDLFSDFGDDLLEEDLDLDKILDDANSEAEESIHDDELYPEEEVLHEEDIAEEDDDIEQEDDEEIIAEDNEEDNEEFNEEADELKFDDFNQVHDYYGREEKVDVDDGQMQEEDIDDGFVYHDKSSNNFEDNIKLHENNEGKTTSNGDIKDELINELFSEDSVEDSLDNEELDSAEDENKDENENEGIKLDAVYDDELDGDINQELHTQSKNDFDDEFVSIDEILHQNLEDEPKPQKVVAPKNNNNKEVTKTPIQKVEVKKEEKFKIKNRKDEESRQRTTQEIEVSPDVRKTYENPKIAVSSQGRQKGIKLNFGSKDNEVKDSLKEAVEKSNKEDIKLEGDVFGKEVKKQKEPKVDNEIKIKVEKKNPENVQASTQSVLNQPKGEASLKMDMRGRLFGWIVSFKNPSGKSFELREGKFFVTRSSLKENDLIINDDSVSTPHAMVTVSKNNGLVIQDLLSDTGIFLKHSKDAEYEMQEAPFKVTHGDWIKFGNVEYLVSLIAHIGE